MSICASKRGFTVYDSKQNQDETISAYCARLQLAINRAEKRGGISPSSRDETLKVVFWKGLADQKVKQAIQHKFETVTNFDELIRAARAAEQESIDFARFHATNPPPTKTRPPQPTNRVAASFANTNKTESDLMSKIDELSEKLNRQECDAKAAPHPQVSHMTHQPPPFQPGLAHPPPPPPAQPHHIPPLMPPNSGYHLNGIGTAAGGRAVRRSKLSGSNPHQPKARKVDKLVGKPMETNAIVNGKPCKCLIDTGSQVTTPLHVILQVQTKKN